MAQIKNKETYLGWYRDVLTKYLKSEFVNPLMSVISFFNVVIQKRNIFEKIEQIVSN